MDWLLNRQEKEDYVIRLYKEDRSIREIAELVLNTRASTEK
jgi:hypothetical protein